MKSQWQGSSSLKKKKDLKVNVVKCRSEEQEGVEGLLLLWFWHFCRHLLPFPHIEWRGFCLSDPQIKEYGTTVRLCHCSWHSPPTQEGLSGGSDCKESACNIDLGPIPGLGRSPGEENGNPLRIYFWGKVSTYSCLGLEEPSGLQSVGLQRVRHPEQLMVTDWYSGSGLGTSCLVLLRGFSRLWRWPCGGFLVPCYVFETFHWDNNLGGVVCKDSWSGSRQRFQ